MSKTFLLSAFLCMTLSSYAQFRVHRNGKIAFNTTATPYSPISLNYNGDINNFISYKGGLRCLYANTEGYTNCANFLLTNPEHVGYTTGVWSQIKTETSQTHNGTSMALRGQSSGSKFNIGVFGTYSCKNHQTEYGVGVFGSSIAIPITATIDKDYAGFFWGDVRITKTLVVDQSIQGILLGASSNASTSSPLAKVTSSTPFGFGSIKESLANLSIGTFQYQEKNNSTKLLNHQDMSSDNEINEEEILKATEEYDALEEQIKTKTHYALNANQLADVFPDLVYEKEDGTQVINYVEMIPLLIQSINELNAEIAQLKSLTSTPRVPEMQYTASIAPSMISSLKAELHQNTPNPFTERTTISFTLPDDAKNAYIYIFDMQGKMQKQLPISSSQTSVTINGYELQAGLYLYSLVINGQEIDTKRMILSKK